jgi:hypothetical protein
MNVYGTIKQTKNEFCSIVFNEYLLVITFQMTPFAPLLDLTILWHVGGGEETHYPHTQPYPPQHPPLLGN